MKIAEDEKKIAESRKANSSAVVDSADELALFTEKDFEQALKKASRKIQPKK
jgi:hypothetical protein